MESFVDPKMSMKGSGGLELLQSCNFASSKEGEDVEKGRLIQITLKE